MFFTVRGRRLWLCAAVLAAVVLLGVAAQAIPAVPVSASGQEAVYLPIIMYHEVKYKKLGKDAISPYEFETDLAYIRDNGYEPITMTRLIDYVYEQEPLPEKPIILTFDDGYLNNYRFVLPLITRYRMSIVFSIIGKNTDDFTEYPSSSIDYAHVTWEQLNEMLDSGYVEVQNHTYNLHSIGKGRTGCMQDPNESLRDYRQILARDVIRLQEALLSKTGRLPNTFAYPYGKASEKTDDVLRELGFRATLSCNYGINVITGQPEELFGLKRVSRAHGTTLQKLLREAEKTIRNKKADAR